MGEARRKKIQQLEASALTVQQIDNQVDLGRVSNAIRKLSEAASGNLGRDCYSHASLCRELLAMQGVECRVVTGFAAWRVGDGDSDVILHAPLPGMVPQGPALPFHSWIEVGAVDNPNRVILDFTTYQLRQKAAELDLLDGGKTTVDWCPEYLAVPVTQVSSLDDVTRLSTGLFFYQHNKEVSRIVLSRKKPIDSDDFRHLLIIYQNPHLNVVGPNDCRPV